MNKLTKLLSVFVIAGAVGASVAGVAGCKKKNGGNNESGHTHNYTWVNDNNGKCHEHCNVDGCDTPDKPAQDHVWGNDNECDHCGATKPDTENPDNPDNPEHTTHTYEYVKKDKAQHTKNTTCTEHAVISVDEDHVDEDHDLECDLCEEDLSVAATGVELGGAAAAVKTGVNVTLNAVVTPSNTTDSVVWSITEGGDIATIDATTGVLTATQAGTVTVQAKAGEVTATHTVRVVKDEEGLTYITSVAEFNKFRTESALSGTYKLACDIDLSGVELPVSTSEINAGVTFDGDGYTISNGYYGNASAKTGLLCREINGGTVTNVKFLSCAVAGAGESVAIVAGECNDGTSTISKVELNACNVTSAGGGYGGLLFGRNEGSTNAVINISEITTKNGCTLTTPQYGGLLVGDAVATTTINFTNMHIDGELKGATGNSLNNGAFLAGRSRGGAYSFTNCVISATAPTGGNSNFIFVGGSNAPKSLTISNVLVVSSNMSGVTRNAATTQSITNLYAVEGVTVTGATAGQNTVAFLSDTTENTGLAFDFENIWMAEGEGGYRLKAASPNIKSADATIRSLRVNNSNAKVRFKKGDTFSADGLTVMGAYSDGVMLVIGYTDDAQATDGYTVDSSAFDGNTAGTYVITVKSVEDPTITFDYEVVVAEEIGFKVYDEFMSHLYTVGTDTALDNNNLVVKSVWSDGIEENVTNYTISPDSFDLTTAGAYTVKVAYGEYAEQDIHISVVASKPVPVDGKVYVNVDANYDGYSGNKVDGIETFTTVADAIKFLEKCAFDADVQKVIYVGEGTYKAKITTSLANLVLIGEGTEKSVLTYSAVESTVDIVSGNQYGLNCATLHVNGEGFKAYNLSIRNDFDYINDAAKESSPQGLALTINGDKAVLENVHLYGNQDTLFLRNGRTYVKNSLIEGNVDFIFGENTGLAYFDHCTINAITRNNSNNGYVTAMRATTANKPDYGYIFNECTFTHGEGVGAGSMSLGRPWGAAATVAMINCKFSEAYSQLGYGDQDSEGKTVKSRWADMSGNSPVGADFNEYGSTDLAGNPIMQEAVNGGKVLTSAEGYTAVNLFKGTNGAVTWTSGDWDYAADSTLLTTVLASDRVVPTGVYVSTESISVEAEKSADLLVSVAPWNANDKSGTITVTSSDPEVAVWENGKVNGLKEGTCTLTVTDGTDSKDVSVTVTAKAAVEVKSYTYDPSDWGTTGSDFDLTADNLTGVNSFLSLADGTARWRPGNNVMEIKNNGLNVTFAGTGTIVIGARSTNNGNLSSIALKDSNGNYVQATWDTSNTNIKKDDASNIYQVTGAESCVLTFTVTTPGEYTICTLASITVGGAAVNTNRNTRINSIQMTDNVVNTPTE